MTTDLLLGDYKHLSRAIIYYEKMIQNERNCSTDATGLKPMKKKVMERMYTMLCHVKQVLGINGGSDVIRKRDRAG
nr:hypothetical protein BaRGS_029199 [Batillaria attramentaria]